VSKKDVAGDLQQIILPGVFKNQTQIFAKISTLKPKIQDLMTVGIKEC